MAEAVPSPDPTDDWIDSAAAVVFAKVSLKTITRATAAGADCGLRKVGRKIVFHRATLNAWLLAQTEKSAALAAPIPIVRLTR